MELIMIQESVLNHPCGKRTNKTKDKIHTKYLYIYNKRERRTSLLFFSHTVCESMKMYILFKIYTPTKKTKMYSMKHP